MTRPPARPPRRAARQVQPIPPGTPLWPGRRQPAHDRADLETGVVDHDTPTRAVRRLRPDLRHLAPPPAGWSSEAWEDPLPDDDSWGDDPGDRHPGHHGSGDDTAWDDRSWDDPPWDDPPWDDRSGDDQRSYDDTEELDAGLSGAAAPGATDRPARPARQELAPWAGRRRAAQDTTPTIVAARVGTAPVFVDDSGRRRRIGRLVASSVVVAVAAYTAVIALNLAGAPLVGNLAPPGVDRLARPVGDVPVVTGPATDVVTLPPPPTSPSDGTAPEPGDETGSTADTTASTTSTAPSTTTTVPSTATTTTTVRGRGPTTTVTPPGATDPGNGNGGDPPDTPPGQG